MTYENRMGTMLPLRFVAVLLLAQAGLSGCQPEDTQPGLWLDGELVSENVADWSHTNAIQEIFIQTRSPYLLPHSTTIWCVELGGELYIGSYGDEKKRWENHVLSNPSARLGIDGRLYAVTISPVADARMNAALDQRYLEKYDMQAVFGSNVPAWWYYHVAQRTEE